MNDTTCPLCNAPVGPDQKYCVRCEQLLSGRAPAQTQARPKWYHNVWIVLLMLVFVLGPLGLPLVWKNPSFSRWIKVALTLAMVVYTVALIDVTLKAVTAVMHEMQQFNGVF